MKARDEAIREILERHGRDAVYVASTGYISRAVHAVAGDDHTVFYMQGSMGLAPAIGLGIALNTERPVVVLNGDASLLMALGSTHTIRDRAPASFFHYVLDNGCHESVGGQPAAALEAAYPGVTEIVKVERGGKPPRVGISPEENSRAVREFLESRPRLRARMLEPRRQVLFNPGPVNLHPEIKANLFNVELCHRQPEFAELDRGIRRRLYAVAGLSPETHRLSLMHGSGTLAVEAALASLVRGRVLVVHNGLYCERIATTLEHLGASVSLLDCGVGRPPSPGETERLARAEGVDWIAAVHHETTTGLLNPLGEIAGAARAAGARLFVDAVSSFGAHELDPGADVICFNSSKCLESLPGIAACFWRADLETHPTLTVLDLQAAADGIPTTPNVQAFIALDIALDVLAAEDRPARYRRLARAIWEAGSRQFELMLPERDRSHVLTSFRLEGRDPDELDARAREHGYVIYHGQRELRGEIFRVANMGAAIDAATIDDLFAVLAA